MKQNTQMTQLGKMFTYIALRQLRWYEAPVDCTDYDASLVHENELSETAYGLVKELLKMFVIRKTPDGEMYEVTKSGGKLVAKYFAACADELRDGHFGTMKWDKGSEFHKALMARIA